MDLFTKAYIECAFWASIASIDFRDEDEPNGTPMDENYDSSDLAPEALTSMMMDCQDFREANAELLAGIDPEQAGHDFWLTRNGHGAGFWDRGLGEVGSKLTDAAHAYGSSDLYVGDDGLVYVSPV